MCPGRRFERLRGAALRSSSSPPAFLLPERDLPGRRRRNHAAPAGWTFARFEQHGGAEPPSPIGGGGYLAHFDVGQPERAAGPALDDPAPELTAQLERAVAPATVPDLFRAPVQELRVERAGGSGGAGVQLGEDDGAWERRGHRLNGRRIRRGRRL